MAPAMTIYVVNLRNIIAIFSPKKLQPGEIRTRLFCSRDEDRCVTVGKKFALLCLIGQKNIFI
jgi:hypothetical protein